MPIETLRLLVMRLPLDPEVAGRSDEGVLPMFASTLLIAAGGVGGALLRAVIERAAPPADGWPWGTLLINITGAGALALLLVVLEEQFPLARIPRPLIGTGVLGGYTTFSTFAVEAVQMARMGSRELTVLYIALSVLGALGAAIGGVLAGRTVARLANRPRWLRRVRAAGLDEPSEDPA